MGNATNATLYNYAGRGLALLSARAPTRRESFLQPLPATALLLLILYLYLVIHFSRSIEQEGDDGLRWVWLLLFSVFQFQRLFPAFCRLFSGSTTDLTPWPGHVSPAPTYIASLPTTPTISPSTLAARADSRGPGTGRPMRLSNIHGLAQTRLHPA